MANILVVEDFPDLAKLLSLLLASGGHQTQTAGTAAEAMGLLLLPPATDLVVLDIMLDGLTGLDLLQIMRKTSATKGVPVIVYTAHDKDELRDVARPLGIAGYLVKGPGSLDAIEAEVNRVLAG